MGTARARTGPVHAQETGSAIDARHTIPVLQVHAVAQIRTAARVATLKIVGPTPTATANVAAILIAASGVAVATTGDNNRVVRVYSVMAAAHRVIQRAESCITTVVSLRWPMMIDERQQLQAETVLTC